MANHGIAGIVLVGTHAWTHAAFDTLLPRPLLPIAGRPLVSFALSWLQQSEIEYAALCGNRDTRALQSHLAGQLPPGMTVAYVEDSMPRGAAGSARDAALATRAETFVIVDGTSIPTVDLDRLLAKHRASGACVTAVVHPEDGRAGAAHVPSGIYVFSRRAFDFVPPFGHCDIKERLVPELHRAGEAVVACEATEATPRVLDASTYMAVNEWMVERLAGAARVQPGFIRREGALIHRDAFVAADAALVGPIVIGPGVRILSEAVVVGPTSIACDATVARGAVVARSALWRRCSIGAGASVDGCIVADDAVVEADVHVLRGIIGGSRLSASNRWTRGAPVGPAPTLGGRLARRLFGSLRQPGSTPP